MEFIKDRARRIRTFGRALLQKDVYVRRDVRIATRLMGDGSFAWSVCPDFIDRSGAVYCAGIGTDISFEVALVGDYGLTIHAFDPTPRSVRWLSTQEVPEVLIHIPVATAGHDGFIMLHAPTAEEHVSYSPYRHSGADGDTVQVPAKRIPTLMNELGHDRLSLLKMDIEGSEYGVLRDIINARIEVDQLLVEFHHRFDGISAKATRDAINIIRGAGYLIFHISPRGKEYSFIHQRCLEATGA